MWCVEIRVPSILLMTGGEEGIGPKYLTIEIFNYHLYHSKSINKDIPVYAENFWKVWQKTKRSLSVNINYHIPMHGENFQKMLATRGGD